MAHIDPDDPLGIDELIAGRKRWDQIEDPPLLEPAGQLPALVQLPPDKPAAEPLPQRYPGQDDLSAQDEDAGELVSTEKVGPLDEVLVQPPQDPEWRPDGVPA